MVQPGNAAIFPPNIDIMVMGKTATLHDSRAVVGAFAVLPPYCAAEPVEQIELVARHSHLLLKEK
jgi:hypothetical protein